MKTHQKTSVCCYFLRIILNFRVQNPLVCDFYIVRPLPALHPRQNQGVKYACQIWNFHFPDPGIGK